MKRFAANSLIVKLSVSVVVILIESIVLASIGIYYHNRFEAEIDTRIEETRGAKPEIRVEMCHDDAAYPLIVSDNGVGLPPDFDMRKMRSLGMALVRSWATHQLKGGKLDVDSKQGTKWTITVA